LDDLRARDPIEWPTLALLGLTYAGLLWGTHALYLWAPAAGIVVTGVLIAQFSSLQHEALHGHPFRHAWLNELLVAPAVFVTVPYGRFRDTHLAHHHDPILTDPYDDPESEYMDPAVWQRLPAWKQALFRFDNTLFGRMTLGPVVGTLGWLAGELRLLVAGAPGVRRHWAVHLMGLLPVAGWLWVAAMPWWGYALALWIGMGLLKIRTFLEHRAHAAPRARSVIVEGRGPLALLFLNNNLHAVHHMHPQVPWYRLPALYAGNRDHYLRRNGGYRYASYAEVFRRFLWRAKEPVAHPLMAVSRPAGPPERRSGGPETAVPRPSAPEAGRPLPPG
jgi:fatty acid desaturase